MLRFPGNSFSMTPYWFEVDMTVTELRLEKIAATEIMYNAFDSKQFHTTEKLEIINSPFRVFKQGAFEGFKKLSVLVLDHVKVLEFGIYVLAPIYKHLTKLSAFSSKMN